MTSEYLHTLDFLVIAAYFAGLFLLGIFFRSQKSSDDYFLAGRRTSSLLAGISVVATLLSTVSFLSLPGEMIRHGTGFFTSLLAFVFIIPTVNYLIIPGLMRLPVTSVYDYLERRYNTSVRHLGAWVFVATRLLWMGLILYVAARAIGPITGWSLPLLVLVMGIVTVFYTTLGGMHAVIWSDFAQFVILFGGAIFVPCYVAVATSSSIVDWWTTFASAERTEVPLISLDPTTRTSVVGMMLMLYVWNVCTHGSDQVAAQRYLSTPSAENAQRTFWVFSLANVAMLGLLMIVGLALFYFRFQMAGMPVGQFQQFIAERADDVFPQFLARRLPSGTAGLLIAALLAAAMSSLSSGINSMSAVVVSDLLPRRVRERSEQNQVALSRFIAAAAGGIAIGGALAIDQLMQVVSWNLVELTERINHLFVAPLGALFFAGICFRHIGTAAALVGFAAGVATSIAVSFSERLFDYPISFMWIMPLSFAISLIAAWTIGHWTIPPAPSQLVGLYRGDRVTG